MQYRVPGVEEEAALSDAEEWMGHAEAEVARATFQGLVETAPDGILVANRAGRIVFVNRRLEAMFGYGREELLGQPIEILMPERFRTAHTRHRARYHAEPRTRPMGADLELLAQRKDGGEFPVEISLSPTRTEQSFLVTSIIRDITERKRGEEERAQLLRREQDARAQAETAQRRLEFLATASSILAGSLEYEAALEQVARLAVPLLADWCAIDIIEDRETVRRLPVAHADPAEAELARQWRGSPPDLDAECGVPRVLRTGGPIFAAELLDLLQVASAPNAEHLDILRTLSPRSAMVIPLSAHGRTLGVMTFLFSHSGRRYSRTDLALAEDLARRIAAAMENARLYRTQKEIAGTLQRSLLPPHLLRVPGVELSACFRPAGEGEGIEMGGDFYDLFETGDRNWALVIGDVTGKGPAAAAVTALVRYTVRTAAMQDPAPGQVLSRTNEAILPQLSEDSFCTLQYAALQPTTNGIQVTLASGGHPPPLLLRGHGGDARAATVQSVGRPGMIVGVAPNPQFPEQVLDLGPGDALVFYTDGVTEARAGSDFFGEERLAALLGTCAGLGAQDIVDRIGHTVVDFQAGKPSDDIAVLVLRVPDPHDGSPRWG